MSPKLNSMMLLKAGRTIRKLSQKQSQVRIVEVGPRDGLQNETINVPTDVKIELIDRLSETGLKSIEVTSFVSPKWVPQMADNKQVYSGIKKKPSVSYSVLVPNVQGLESALTVGVKEVAVFASASEGFARKNTNCSIEEGIERIKAITERAKQEDLKIRGYVSCIVGCPYDGHIRGSAVARVTEALLELGCYEVSLGDTIGVGTKSTMTTMLQDVLKISAPDQLAIHCHDTYGQGLVNTLIALDHGITVVDSSISGLGGCPYAEGASGNVATEDVVYMLHGLGLETGVHLKKLIEAGRFISKVLQKPSGSKVNHALHNKHS